MKKPTGNLDNLKVRLEKMFKKEQLAFKKYLRVREQADSAFVSLHNARNELLEAISSVEHIEKNKQWFSQLNVINARNVYTRAYARYQKLQIRLRSLMAERDRLRETLDKIETERAELEEKISQEMEKSVKEGPEIE